MMVFVHANGFPPGSYRQLLSQVDGEVKPLKLTPLRREFTHREALSNWHDYTEEILNDLKKLPGPILGIGHSMGAISLLIASVRAPELFKGLILIEPTLLPRRFVAFSRLIPQWINRQFHPVASKAYHRRDHWSSNEEAFKHLRSKHLFENISDQVLQDHIEASLVDSTLGGKTLLFTKIWEEHCFTNPINPWPWLKRSRAPSLGIFGEKSDLIVPKILNRWKKSASHTQFVLIKDAGHLVPLEQPELVASEINQFLSQLN